MDLACRLVSVGDVPVLLVNGVIDMATIPVLRDQLARALRRHVRATLHVDLDGVTTLDDTGLGVLLGAASSARRGGGDLVVVASTAHLVEQLALTGFDRAVAVRPRIADV